MSFEFPVNRGGEKRGETHKQRRDLHQDVDDFTRGELFPDGRGFVRRRSHDVKLSA
jgi:hypothetical protein